MEFCQGFVNQMAFHMDARFKVQRSPTRHWGAAGLRSGPPPGEFVSCSAKNPHENRRGSLRQQRLRTIVMPAFNTRCPPFAGEQLLGAADVNLEHPMLRKCLVPRYGCGRRGMWSDAVSRPAIRRTSNPTYHTLPARIPPEHLRRIYVIVRGREATFRAGWQGAHVRQGCADVRIREDMVGHAGFARQSNNQSKPWPGATGTSVRCSIGHISHEPPQTGMAASHQTETCSTSQDFMGRSERRRRHHQLRRLPMKGGKGKGDVLGKVGKGGKGEKGKRGRPGMSQPIFAFI